MRHNAPIENTNGTSMTGTSRDGERAAPIDTTRRIQYDFATSGQQESAEYFQRADVRQRRFTETLKHWVELEYRQYEHYSDAHTSHTKLGDALQALSGRLRPSSRRASEQSAHTGGGEPFSGSYSRFNLMQAVGSLLALDDPAPSCGSLLASEVVA